ncbi:putative membrane protein [Legionella oakridgensis ATCC 33761 = DSM 21215]|uniref:Putative membrane protein n=5 Tax=Legionella oakridgensis TaxID=29423 RepID=W0B8N7_9GAMM|nr:putative membrane protein [Legionella oakridgensis ATCC 33761 = DSM 21215]STY20001.1 Domain of uncharacterised function DUF [Legionella longbeachae]
MTWGVTKFLMMQLMEVILIGLVLSADSFSAALAMGFRPHKNRDALIFACLSGGTEALITLIGAMTGEKIVSRFSPVDQWIAFLLLAAVAIHMVYEGLSGLKPSHFQLDVKFHGFIRLLMVSLATSIDALAVGVGLGVADKPIIPFIISIGGWAFASTILGMAIAKRVSKRLGPLFNLIGALILFILAIRMFDL